VIHSFSCENFYSIGKKIKVDFNVNELAPKKFCYANAANDTRVSLVETVLGPNAAGKTTVLKVLAYVRWLIVDAYTDDPDHPLPVRPFGNRMKNAKKVSSVSVQFSINDRMFMYDIKTTRERIISEALREKSKANERITTKMLFAREWNSIDNEYWMSDKVFGLTKEKLRKNSSAVATAFRDKNPLATEIAQYWRDKITTNVAETGYRNYSRTTHDHLAHSAIEFFHEKPELKKQVEYLLSKYDLGFGAFKKEEVQERTFFSIEHKFNSGSFDLPLEYESSGTKQVIIILQYILSALSAGGIAVIDELDANLHPEIVQQLISMFTSKESNPNSAQILFSSHTPTILNMLDKYQITFVQKRPSGQTDVWRLDSLKGVRTDDNYYAKYITGAFGALPEIG
jgi:uncharacterized protein